MRALAWSPNGGRTCLPSTFENSTYKYSMLGVTPETPSPEVSRENAGLAKFGKCQIERLIHPEPAVHSWFSLLG
jgi:hypothetical protein